MPFSIVIRDITSMKVDAIVNSTNTLLVGAGRGVDRAIHMAAGSALQDECDYLAPCPVGEIRCTSGYNLPCKTIIHTVGPIWHSRSEDIQLLESCYEKILSYACSNNIRSLAMPLISAGHHGFPKEVVLKTAIDISKKYLLDYDIDIYLVVYSRELASDMPEEDDSIPCGRPAYPAYDRRARDYEAFPISSEIVPNDDESDFRHSLSSAMHYNAAPVCGAPLSACAHAKPLDYRPDTLCDGQCPEDTVPASAEDLCESFSSILDIDESFGKTVYRLSRQKYEKSSQYYVTANITKQIFSKMKNEDNYRPSRAVAIASVVALGLSLDQAQLLLERAGFRLTSSFKEDRIIMEAISNGRTDVITLNIELFEKDLALLGCA